MRKTGAFGAVLSRAEAPGQLGRGELVDRIAQLEQPIAMRVPCRDPASSLAREVAAKAGRAEQISSEKKSDGPTIT
jgi:hypothetical protein